MSTESIQSTVALRSGTDRLRHALLFECVALAIVIPCGSILFGVQASDMGAIGIGSALTAMLWNYLYNLLFDHAMLRLRGSTSKTITVRLLHTVLFETGLQIVLLPAIALYLGVSITLAFSLSMSIALFYLVYAFAFNMAYDSIFPAGHTTTRPTSVMPAE